MKSINAMKRSLIIIGAIIIVVFGVFLIKINHMKKSISNATSYRNGQFSGSVDSAYYGNVQVQVDIQNNKITDVSYLQYPNADYTSIYIAKGVLPLLKKELIKAQSANINAITGATYTSEAFIKSLQAALNKA